MRMLNLGILAHVDAGKTSLTERLLFDSGAIPTMGAVDEGSTRTDGMDLERRRGITIRSAVATFTADDRVVNLIDTPGHADFVAEVERALGVLDGAILVVSAVEGVQTQTRVLMRTLTALAVPTLVFVNKIDRSGARADGLMADIRRLLSPAAIAMSAPRGLGTASATAPAREPDAQFAEELAELLAEHSDEVLESYVDDPGRLDVAGLRRELSAQARAALVHPVYFGSAITGTGIDALRRAIPEFLPAAGGDGSGPLDGTVFAIERNGSGAKSAVVRLFSGSLGARDTVTFSRRDPSGALAQQARKATNVYSAAGQPARIPAGGIARVTGLRGIRVGDRLGPVTAQRPTARFRPPTLETVVTPRDPGSASALFAALGDLAEQDPLIDVRRGAQQTSLTVSLYGEVQQEVIAARLAEEFGVAAEFSPPRVVCIERLVGTGAALEQIGAGGRTYFWATIGLRIEPGAPGSGVRFHLEAERGSLPAAFLKAIEETVHSTLREGLSGWQVVDCSVTLTHTGYFSPVSTAGDFRNQTPLVLMTALQQAATVVCEPLDRLELELPASALSAVLAALTRSGGLPEAPETHGGLATLEAVIPAARLRAFERQLPGLTAGAAVLTSRFEGYRQVTGATPTRPRTDHNPLDREEYLLRVLGTANPT